MTDLQCPEPGWQASARSLRASLDQLETKLQQSGMVERSTVGVEEFEHRVEDHLPHREPTVIQPERRP